MARREPIRGRKSGKTKAKNKPKPRKREVTAKDIEPVYPWERQPDESQQAFAAFMVYLEGDGAPIMPERSVRDTSRKLKKYYSQISKWSADNDWVRRAEAKDRHDLKKRSRDQERDIEIMNDRQARDAMIAAAAAMNHIRKFIKTKDNPNPQQMRDRDAIRLFDVATRVERRSRGEADSVIHQGVTVEATVTGSVDDRRASMVKLLENPDALEHMAALSKLLGTDGGYG